MFILFLSFRLDNSRLHVETAVFNSWGYIPLVLQDANFDGESRGILCFYDRHKVCVHGHPRIDTRFSPWETPCVESTLKCKNRILKCNGYISYSGRTVYLGVASKRLSNYILAVKI